MIAKIQTMTTGSRKALPPDPKGKTFNRRSTLPGPCSHWRDHLTETIPKETRVINCQLECWISEHEELTCILLIFVPPTLDASTSTRDGSLSVSLHLAFHCSFCTPVRSRSLICSHTMDQVIQILPIASYKYEKGCQYEWKVQFPVYVSLSMLAYYPEKSSFSTSRLWPVF